MLYVCSKRLWVTERSSACPFSSPSGVAPSTCASEKLELRVQSSCNRVYTYNTIAEAGQGTYLGGCRSQAKKKKKKKKDDAACNNRPIHGLILLRIRETIAIGAIIVEGAAKRSTSCSLASVEKGGGGCILLFSPAFPSVVMPNRKLTAHQPFTNRHTYIVSSTCTCSMCRLQFKLQEYETPLPRTWLQLSLELDIFAHLLAN
jgi:hypothetical protein